MGRLLSGLCDSDSRTEEATVAGIWGYDENGLPIFHAVEINLDPKFEEAMEWHKRQLREGVRDGVLASSGGMKLVPAAQRPRPFFSRTFSTQPKTSPSPGTTIAGFASARRLPVLRSCSVKSSAVLANRNPARSHTNNCSSGAQTTHRTATESPSISAT